MGQEIFIVIIFFHAHGNAQTQNDWIGYIRFYCNPQIVYKNQLHANAP